MSEKTTIGIRLAIRSEGKYINAYLAPAGSMEGSLLLGSLLASLAERSADTFEAFKRLMSAALALAVEDETAHAIRSLLPKEEGN